VRGGGAKEGKEGTRSGKRGRRYEGRLVREKG